MNTGFKHSIFFLSIRALKSSRRDKTCANSRISKYAAICSKDMLGTAAGSLHSINSETDLNQFVSSWLSVAKSGDARLTEVLSVLEYPVHSGQGTGGRRPHDEADTGEATGPTLWECEGQAFRFARPHGWRLRWLSRTCQALITGYNVKQCGRRVLTGR
jgi:hypothetical protein